MDESTEEAKVSESNSLAAPKVVYDPKWHCGAKTKQRGGPCLMPKGWGVKGRSGNKQEGRPGVGQCKLHGGSGAVALIKHGRRSLYRGRGNPKLDELMKQVDKAGRDATDLTEEMSLLRAGVLQAVQDGASWEEVLARVKEVRSTSVSIQRIDSDQIVTKAQVALLHEGLISILTKHLSKKLLAKIRNELADLELM